ncbi:MAG: type VI secretion system ATPase TssH, partial [Verrucomicrobia bacterium]|nr:type VI secretion system ATPase TssH [Verrucomicrobiota bacterium]
MRIDRFTAKLQEGLQESQALAAEYHQQEITPEQLLLVLLRKNDGLARPLLEKLQVRTQDVESELERELAKRPKVSGSTAEPFIGTSLRDVLNEAENEMQKLKDEYV